ncbi:DNA/RNA non-specific endonuclease [Parasalinivibrio latis]|uniref:DNA/RNA non-specific endonuclease n=1 Tax=Parasalinivibrio latis TaxID=2952610 RepID=UPI0030E56AB8
MGKRVLIFWASLALSLWVKAEVLSVHCPLGCPEAAAGNDVVFTHIYALSMNPKTKFADWVAYEVNVTNFGPGPGRNWSNNPIIASEDVLEYRDYGDAFKELKMNKGHLAPLAAFAGNQYWYETNYISNIAPQKSDLNQGPWEDLEQAVRKAVVYGEPLYVVTGTLYEGNIGSLPKADEEHVIPSGFYKVVYDIHGNSAAFVMDQRSSRSEHFCGKLVSLAAIKGRLAYGLPILSSRNHVVRLLGCF